jgi:hypothetical protein
MTDNEELAYMRGQRSVWDSMLRECLVNLGVDEARFFGWVSELEAAIAALRRVCSKHGDNDWSPDLYLADIIEKHLERHLEERL